MKAYFLIFWSIACWPSIAAAGEFWNWSVPRLGSVDTQGGLAWSYELPRIELGSGETIPLQATLRAPENTGVKQGTEIEWSVPQVSSFLAPRKGGRWLWLAPDGAQRLFEPPFAGGGTSLLVNAEGFGCVVTGQGWRFFYQSGALYRILSPKGVMLRVKSDGPRIRAIEMGPISRPIALLAVEYSAESHRIQHLETPRWRVSFLTSSKGEPVAAIDGNGGELVRISYANEVIAAIKTNRDEGLPVKWRRLRFWESALKAFTRSDFVVGELGDQKYDLETTQSDLTIRMKTPQKNTLMIYNYYSQRAQYADLP